MGDKGAKGFEGKNVRISIRSFFVVDFILKLNLKIKIKREIEAQRMRIYSLKMMDS